MRREPTEPQKRLWRHLSNRQRGGFTSRRQAPLGWRNADVSCRAIGLIVEADGDTHDAETDTRRDAMSRRHGLHVIRFTNAEVILNMDGVPTSSPAFANSLPPRVNRRLPHPNPSPEGERF
jgi:very-short-patch-repair endonuclease